jgi:hypothetical protein
MDWVGVIIYMSGPQEASAIPPGILLYRSERAMFRFLMREKSGSKEIPIFSLPLQSDIR